MSDYYLTDAELAKVVHDRYVGAAGRDESGEIPEYQTVTGMTRDEWNNLSESRQRELYFDYSAGADAGKWNDPSNALPRGTQPERGEWKAKAEDGYEVDPAELRSLAGDMKYKLDIWKRKLNKVGATSITQADLGNIQGSEQFVNVATASKTGFQEYIGAIETAYLGVIENLKRTADQYENAHGNTKKNVDGVNPTGDPNLS
ncbi:MULTISPECIES: hypothetical protein [Actinomadura]|uniref:Uncharacterized protein n=1 Tax=Actinomadura geliboluensis TaxID=882440 RepID=A0A5S4GPH9_9ACTN|nr:hypothetical protein [Actinomadura geliboluensis]TMR34729.1 hypothetical protein ETD96_24610 [Actinomadura geliboluensis]